MDSSSNNLGDTEECSSNESGWTMYIASPGEEDNPDGEDADSHGSRSSERKEYKFVPGEDGGSDDSMASDASSGPSHQGTCKKSHDKGSRRSSGGGDKRSKQVERKGGAQKPKAGKEEDGGKARSSRTSADVYSKGKSRKNN